MSRLARAGAWLGVAAEWALGTPMPGAQGTGPSWRHPMGAVVQHCLRLVWNNRVLSLGTSSQSGTCSHLARELNMDAASGQCCH